MSINYFVAGTDTEVGKTYVSVGLLKAFQQRGLSAIGVKPIASGAVKREGCLYNQDALNLLEASSIKLPYDMINPIVFEAPIAPSIAAARAGKSLSVQQVIASMDAAMQQHSDVRIVEGVGGLLVPLNDHETLLPVIAHYQMQIILVVGLRLGCMNHAILTYEAIKQAGLPIAGWVANGIQPSGTEDDEMVASLQCWLKAPFLGKISYQQPPEEGLLLDVLLPERLSF